MTTIDDLPDTVVRRILQFSEQHIVYQLLKSKTVAALAYSVLYENVILEPVLFELPNVKDHNLYDRIKRNYIDDSSSKHDLSGMELIIQPVDRSLSFDSARELISFYKSHPLYQPHTLTYYNNCCLTELEKLKPGFLNKFKFFIYDNGGLDTITFNVSNLKHKVFTASKIWKSSRYPKYIETLRHPADTIKSVMPMVKEIGIKGSLKSYNKFPNLQTLVCTMNGKLDIPSLRNLTIVTTKADLTKLKNLRSLFLQLDDFECTFGYSSKSDIRLPDNLHDLSVPMVTRGSRIMLERGGESLRELSITFSSHHGTIQLDEVKLPPNLTRLALSTSSPGLNMESKLVSDYQEFPNSIEILTLKGVSLRNPVFPPKLTALHLDDSHFSGIDVKEFGDLSTLSVTKYTTEFPPQLETLELIEYRDDGSYRINEYSNLKKASINFWKPSSIPELTIPPSMNILLLVQPWGGNVSGGENLIRLTIGLYKSSPHLSFSSLKSLRILELYHRRSTSEKPHSLPSFPPSLESLILCGMTFPDDFTCPENLKCLDLQGCTFSKSSCFSLNDNLEALFLDRVHVDAKLFFKHPCKSLETIKIGKSKLGTLDIDFSGTNLQRFSIQSTTYIGKKVKFPKCFKSLRMYDTNNDQSSWFIDWADFSLCNQLGDLYYPNVSIQKTNNKNIWKAYNEQISNKMEKFIVPPKRAVVDDRKFDKKDKYADNISIRTETMSIASSAASSKLSRKVRFWK